MHVYYGLYIEEPRFHLDHSILNTASLFCSCCLIDKFCCPSSVLFLKLYVACTVKTLKEKYSPIKIKTYLFSAYSLPDTLSLKNSQISFHKLISALLYY